MHYLVNEMIWTEREKHLFRCKLILGGKLVLVKLGIGMNKRVARHNEQGSMQAFLAVRPKAEWYSSLITNPPLYLISFPLHTKKLEDKRFNTTFRVSIISHL